MQTQMTSCRIATWNVKADDIMMMWFALYVNPSDITLGMHNMHTCAWHMWKFACLSI